MMKNGRAKRRHKLVIIVAAERPKRIKLTAEESIRRTEDFIGDPKRKKQFIDAIRNGIPYRPGGTS